MITINIGDESLHFNKSRAIGPDDDPPDVKLVARPKLPKRKPKLIVDNNERDDD